MALATFARLSGGGHKKNDPGYNEKLKRRLSDAFRTGALAQGDFLAKLFRMQFKPLPLRPLFFQTENFIVGTHGF
jgi:hypothetical protein